VRFEFDAEQWSKFGSINLSGTIKQGRIEFRGSFLAAGLTANKALQADNIRAILDYQQDGKFVLTADANNFRSAQLQFAEHFTAIRSLCPDPNLGRGFQNFLDSEVSTNAFLNGCLLNF
jgi:hypothetical protein